jgi:hypothetical protein
MASNEQQAWQQPIKSKVLEVCAKGCSVHAVIVEVKLIVAVCLIVVIHIPHLHQPTHQSPIKSESWGNEGLVVQVQRIEA